jgi:WD40 repeat protein
MVSSWHTAKVNSRPGPRQVGVHHVAARCPAWPVPDTERRVHAAPVDGTWLAAGSEVDASLRIWDPATAACTKTLDGHYRTAK